MKFGAIVSSAAAVLGFAAVADAKRPGPVRAGCTCYGSCSVMGDPHVRNWFNEDWIATEKHLNILKTPDVSIWADVTKEFHFMTEIHFNNELVSTSKCDKNGNLPKSTFQAKGVTMKVKCAKPKKTEKRGDAWHLDIIDLTIKENSGLFGASSQGKGMSGVCVSHKPKKSANPSGLDKVVFKKVPTMHCECSAHCSVWGDPHVESFYGVDKLLPVSKNSEITLYEIKGGFKVQAKVNDKKYMEEITVQGKTYALGQCGGKGRSLRADGGKVLDTFDVKVRNGKVSGKVLCQTEKRGKMKGQRMLNVELTKTDSDMDSISDFKAMEKKQNAKGVCTLEQ